MVKCTVKRTIDDNQPEVVNQQADSREELKANLISDYERDSRRTLTTAASADWYKLPDACIWHYELRWEDGDVEDIVLSFPSPTATPYDDEVQWLEMTSSVPLWSTDTIRICINDLDRAQAVEETREFVAARVRQLPDVVLNTLSDIDLEINVRCVMPNGEVFRIGCAPVKVDVGPPLPENEGELLRDILNELMSEEQAGDGTD